MIVVLADDFSGAAELAGIAAARGFRAEVQTQFQTASGVEVIALDTDTRSRSEAEAIRITTGVCREVLAANPAWIFKKTDSVLRGHPRAEIEAILETTGLDDCCLMPANPSKDRIVRDGIYFISGTPIAETFFARDPDFPRLRSDVRGLLGASARVRIPNAESVDDLPPLRPGPRTLAAGAADYFSTLLGAGTPKKEIVPCPRTLLVCGSLAAWETGRANQMHARGFWIQSIDDPPLSGDAWETKPRIMLTLGNSRPGAMEELTAALIDAALALDPLQSDLRIGLEGGATAIAFVRRLGWTRFEAIPEGHEGVATLRPPGGPILCVKPGSYSWPDGALAE